jgi:acyl carrier protein
MALSKEAILEKLAEIITAETGKPASEVTLERTFTDNIDDPKLSLDIDSISVLTIITNAEEVFGVVIPESIQSDLKSVGDVVDAIAEAQK